MSRTVEGGVTPLEEPPPQVASGAPFGSRRDPPRIPRSLEFAAGVSWRLIVVGAAVVLTFMLLARLQVVLVSAAIAILLASALWPLVKRLRAAGAPPSVAALLTLGGLLAIFGLTAWIVAPYAANDVRELDVNVSEGVAVIEDWLVEGPLGLSERQVQNTFDRFEAQVRSIGNRALRGVWDEALFAVELIAGILLAIVLAFFFLKDGDRIWRWISGLIPARRREAWNGVAVDVREVLAGYLRGTSLVAATDAIGIGLGLFLLGVPLVIPIALLTFLGGFIPLIGATIAGFVAVMVALVSNGFLTALAVLGVVIGVQQLEGNVLQPMIVGRSVNLHPVVILLAVGIGAVLWGIAGALLAVPLTAALATVLKHQRQRPTTDEDPVDSVLEGT